MTETLKEARATTKSSVIILLDLSAAHDTVSHSILLSILSSMGITGRAHSWFESYLTGWSFKVSWLGHTSAAHHLTIDGLLHGQSGRVPRAPEPIGALGLQSCCFVFFGTI